jgi:transcriptional regulator with XRE-family HTH domain
MALQSVTMTTPGEEVRRARLARGWSLSKLAKQAGVSDRTIKRIEDGSDPTDSSRSLPRVQRALGLGHWADVIDDGPPLRQATVAEIAAELVRRDTETARLLDSYRLRSGKLPDGLLDEPGIITPPDADDGAQSGT